MNFAHVLTVYTVEYEDETGDGFVCWQLGFPQADFWRTKSISVGLYVPADGYLVEGSAHAPTVRQVGSGDRWGLRDAIFRGLLRRVDTYYAPVSHSKAAPPAPTTATSGAA